MQRCKLCGEMTYGSVGAAGIKWPFLCQKCKDKEDQALLCRIKHAAKIVDLALTEGERDAEKTEDNSFKVQKVQSGVVAENSPAQEVSELSEPGLGYAEPYPEDSGKVINMPECCGREMTEIESGFVNEIGEYEIIGYECELCGFKVDTNGKELG